MAYLDATDKARIADIFPQTLGRTGLGVLLTELAKLESAFRLLGFTGAAAAGACTLTGAKVGDKVVGIINLTDGTVDTSDFEGTITVADQIQQTDVGNLSTKTYAVLLIAKS